jgi:hypothetical protein
MFIIGLDVLLKLSTVILINFNSYVLLLTLVGILFLAIFYAVRNGYNAEKIPRYSHPILHEVRLRKDTSILAEELNANIGSTPRDLGYNFVSPDSYNNITAKYLTELYGNEFIFGPHPSRVIINGNLVQRVRQFEFNVPYSYRTLKMRLIELRNR